VNGWIQVCWRSSAGEEKRARQVKYHQPHHKNRKNDRNHTHKSQNLRLPNKVNASTRFFASLLSSSVHDIVHVDVNVPHGSGRQGTNDDTGVMSDICQRAGIPLPSPLSSSDGSTSTDRDKHHFFASRASLVMEEARCIIADSLPHHQNQNRHRGNHAQMSKRRKYPMHVDLVNVKMDKHGFGNLMFQKTPKPNSYGRGRSFNERKGTSASSTSVLFTTSELTDMKPGCIMELTWQDEDPNFSNNSTTGSHGNGHARQRSILTNIIPSSDFDHRTAVQLMAYRMDDVLSLSLALRKDSGSVSFQLIPVTNLISEQRQFVACFYPPKVDFIPKLIGMKSATHLRFADSDEDEEDVQNESERPPVADSDSDAAADQEEKKMVDECDALDQGAREYHDSSSTTTTTTTTTIDANIPNRLPLHDEISMTSMNIPMLNPTQEHAATSFLHGPSHNLSLVQGPPGTGKNYLHDGSPLSNIFG